jgi:homospermidine synthase
LAATFTNKMLVLGAGSVSQCVLPLLTEHLLEARQITVIDFQDNRERIASTLAKGAKFTQLQITEENLDQVLSEHLSAGDFLLDLAWNIDANVIIQWCHDHGVLYLNTSVEEWDPYLGGSNRNPIERTLYYRHMRLRSMKSTWNSTGPTAIVEHGANPGLVSHLVKKALVDIATRGLSEGKVSREVETTLTEERYNDLAHRLGVKVIHIAERDTQVTNHPKQWDEFVNTWSVEGFYEEGIAPAELGWGTHEKTLPLRGLEHPTGPKNQICIAQPGATTWVRSWVPNFEIAGMVIRHGEAFTISDHLTVHEGERRS